MTFVDAVERAQAEGASNDEIHAEARRQRPHVGTVPFNNMIRALELHSWRNTKDDWVRLAGALLARRSKRAAA